MRSPTRTWRLGLSPALRCPNAESRLFAVCPGGTVSPGFCDSIMEFVMGLGKKPLPKVEYVTGDYRLVSNDATRVVGRRGQDEMGYGLAITTGIVLQFAETKRKHHVYCTCFSNIGSLWIKVKGKRLYLGTVFSSDLKETFYAGD